MRRPWRVPMQLGGATGVSPPPSCARFCAYAIGAATLLSPYRSAVRALSHATPLCTRPCSSGGDTIVAPPSCVRFCAYAIGAATLLSPYRSAVRALSPAAPLARAHAARGATGLSPLPVACASVRARLERRHSCRRTEALCAHFLMRRPWRTPMQIEGRQDCRPSQLRALLCAQRGLRSIPSPLLQRFNH